MPLRRPAVSGGDAVPPQPCWRGIFLGLPCFHFLFSFHFFHSVEVSGCLVLPAWEESICCSCSLVLCCQHLLLGMCTILHRHGAKSRATASLPSTGVSFLVLCLPACILCYLPARGVALNIGTCFQVPPFQTHGCAIPQPHTPSLFPTGTRRGAEPFVPVRMLIVLSNGVCSEPEKTWGLSKKAHTVL